jgi:CelD/BcsL family acetyltransferase involved in cellulose biosynthesis
VSRVVAEVCSSAEIFGKLEAEWRALFAVSPSAAPPLLWEWQSEWWRLLGPLYDTDGNGLRLIAVRRDSRLIGILPLYLGRTAGGHIAARRLCFVSGGEREGEDVTPEYLDLLSAPGEEHACLEAIAKRLQPGAEVPWDVLELENLRADSPLLSWAEAWAGEVGARLRRAEVASPVADLTDGMEAYLLRKSAKQRNRFRQLLRCEELPGVRFELASGPSESRVFFEQMLDLHLAHWRALGRTTSLASSRVVEFHLSLVERLASPGHVMIGRVCQNARVLAVVHGFVVNRKFDFYQSGVLYAEDLPVASPGVAAHLLMMRSLAERGVTTYDFLGGAAEYKRRLATGQQVLVGVRIVRPTMRSLGYMGYRLGERILKRVRGAVAAQRTS